MPETPFPFDAFFATQKASKLLVALPCRCTSTITVLCSYALFHLETKGDDRMPKIENAQLALFLFLLFTVQSSCAVAG